MWHALLISVDRLSSNVGFSSNSLNNLFESSALGWSFGPAISLPIFDAGSRRANA